MREITIRGNVCPIHFGLKAINDFAKRTGKDFSTTITTTDAIATFESLAGITALGLNEGARQQGLKERYTEDDVWDFFDENPRLVLDVADIFRESIAALTQKLGDIDPNG